MWNRRTSLKWEKKMDILKKAKPWVVASVLVAISGFAEQKNMNKNTPALATPMPAPLTAAYNAPARVDVCGSWDVYADASFIYWQPTQDNSEFGISSSKAAAATANIFGTTATPVSNYMVNLNTNYKPGFEIGLGLNFGSDNWDSCLQYTWFHNTNSNKFEAATGASVFPSRLQPGATGSAGSFDSANASWNLKMDLADWQLGRSYYVGKKLTFRPFVGLRGAWIRQKYNTTYTRTSVEASTVQIAERSTSWGLGAEAGMNASFLLDWGFRLFGDVESDIIYTRYKTNYSEEDVTGTQTMSLKQSKLAAVRPHANIDLGLGWGSYFYDNKCHFDLAASYGFQAFWDQNMFRHFTDTTATYNSQMPNGNLYVQGLNLTARFDF